MTIFLVACGLILAPTVGWSELLINEFLPDPAGTDSGQEFVELFNTGPAPVELAAVELQFANGSVGADWVTRWTGSGPGTVPAGGRFLIVDRNWLGVVTGDAEVYLGLQNGPDAIRLVRGPVVLDLVGYGSLTDQELFEGAPVAVPTGQALARRPDGTDTQDNAADFVAAGATPGARNFLPYSIAVVDQDFDPPVLIRPGDPLRVTVVLRNDGTEDLVGGPCELAWAGGSVSAWWDAAPPDAERTLVFVTRPALRGIVPLTWRYAVPGGADTLRSQVGSVQIGASLMRLQEVMPAPDSGQGEWVEIAWTGPEFGNLAGHSLRDEDGGWVVLPDQAMGPGQLVVVAADSSGLMDWWWANRLAGAAGCGETTWPPTIVSPGSWPSLNNTAPSSRLHADRVFLADPQGVVIDAVAWGGQLQELPGRNLSLERIGPEPVNPGSAHWMVSTSLAGSTPGCANSVSSAEPLSHQGEALQVTPPLLDRLRGPSAVHIRFGLAGPESSWEVVLFNLWGDQVRDFGGDARGVGPRELVWDGRDDTGQVVAVGPYIAWLEIRSDEALVLRREKSVVVVR